MTTDDPQDPATPVVPIPPPVDALDVGQPTPVDDPLLAPDHVPQHALGEPVAPWPESTLMPDTAPPVPGPAEMSDAELMASANALTANVAQLSVALDAERIARAEAIETEQQARAADKKGVYTWLKRGGGFIAFDVVVTVAGLVAGFVLYGTIHAVEAQQLVQQQQLAYNCYISRLIVNNYDPSGPARRLYKAGPLAYDEAYLGIYTGAVGLNCPNIARPAFPVPLGAPAGPVVPPTVISPAPRPGR